MIEDVVIIKDGIPILSKNYSNSQKNIFSKYNDLVLVSGFFSALNSFSDQFENLGSICELQLSNNNCKLSFVKDPRIPNLLYLASFDDHSKGVNVQKYLRKISRTFLTKYNANEISKWAGRVDAFKSFEKIINKYVEREKKETEIHKENVINLFSDVREISDDKVESNKIMLDAISNVELIEEKKVPDYYNFVPSFKVSKNVNPKDFLTGEISIKVFNQINGARSIDQIAGKLEINQERVFAIIKNLIKMGFCANW